MADKSFLSDVDELGWQRKRLAETLGVTTETLRVWIKHGPPPVARLAVRALASGWRP